jgi:hypothetical protein
MLTERRFRCDWTLAQSPVSSFDQGEVIWCDRTLRAERPNTGCQRPVDSSKVPESGFRDRTRPVSADRTLLCVRLPLNCLVLG